MWHFPLTARRAVAEALEAAAGVRCTVENVYESPSLESLVDCIFGEGRWDDTEWLTGRAILADHNNHVNQVNDVISQLFSKRFPADEPAKVFVSWHSVTAQKLPYSVWPTEFLNCLDPPDLPPHKLCLRKGMPVILLHSVNAAAWLAKGTRMIVRAVSTDKIDAEVATGSHVGERVSIQRIDQLYKPLELMRNQLPVRLAFAMTSNEARGQNLRCTGLFQPRPLSNETLHGQP